MQDSDEEKSDEGMTVEVTMSGLRVDTTQLGVRVWVGVAVFLWAVAYVSVWVMSVFERKTKEMEIEDSKEPTFRVPAGQYSDLWLGAGTCVVVISLLALSSPRKKGVGVVRDKELKVEDGKASHTLGGAREGGT